MKKTMSVAFLGLIVLVALFGVFQATAKAEMPRCSSSCLDGCDPARFCQCDWDPGRLTSCFMWNCQGHICPN